MHYKLKKALLFSVLSAALLYNPSKIIAEEIIPDVTIRAPPLTSETVYDKTSIDTDRKLTTKEAKEIYAKNLVETLAIYDGEKEDEDEIIKNKDKSLVYVFSETLENNLNRDFAYYSFREYDDGLPFPGVFVGTVGDALRKKYEVIKKVDKAIKTVQDATTLKAEIQQTKIKIRPSFDDVGERQINARILVENFLTIDQIITKVGKEGFRTGFEVPLYKNNKLYLEGGYNWDDKDWIARAAIAKRL
jgi:hypothetical protein